MRTLQDYRPQHDEDCGSRWCNEHGCGGRGDPAGILPSQGVAMGLRPSWGIVLIVAMLVAMGWVDSAFEYLKSLPDVQRNIAAGLILSGIGTVGVALRSRLE